jgi:peptidoglycan/LPS O-acetylase OafA/YrhL
LIAIVELRPSAPRLFPPLQIPTNETRAKYATIARTRDFFNRPREGKELARKVFETMNGLRGLAALVVLMYHRPEWYGSLCLPSGFLAVDLFFALSGFVIAYSYEEKLSKDMNLSDFLALRLIRLYPLYMLGTICSVSVIALSYYFNGHINDDNKSGVFSIPFALFMLPTPDFYNKLSALYPLNIPAWSLLFEVIVNVFYALTWRWWKPRLLVLVMLVTAVLILMHSEYADSGWNWDSFGFGLLRVLYSFPAGVMIYRLYRENSLPSYTVNSVAILVAFLIMLIAAYGRAAQFCAIFGFPLLVAAAVRSEPAALFRPLFSTLGSASYAIYSIHGPLMIFVKASLAKLGANSHPHVIGAVFLAAIIPLALLIDRWFDAPVRKSLHVIFTPRPAARS